MSLFNSMKRCNDCGTVAFPDAKRCPKCSTIYSVSDISLPVEVIHETATTDIYSEIGKQINLAIFEGKNRIPATKYATIDITAKITIPIAECPIF